MADLARSSLALPANAAFGGRLAVAEVDLLAGRTAREAAGLFDGAFQTVLTNPPFHPAGGRASPEPSRQAARSMPEPDFLQRWLAAASALLEPGGLLLLVARPDSLQAVLDAATNRYGDIRLRPVHPRPERPASRILLAARRGSKAPFQILPPVVLADAQGRATPMGAAIGDGRAAIDFEIAR
ncbi:hypothetical protein ASG43_03935 [Aureimonas sp. Leaf454]|nr:hypothetical protein ASG43_03935 [Aureimonas sp. Leaf454]